MMTEKGGEFAGAIDASANFVEDSFGVSWVAAVGDRRPVEVHGALGLGVIFSDGTDGSGRHQSVCGARSVEIGTTRYHDEGRAGLGNETSEHWDGSG